MDDTNTEPRTKRVRLSDADNDHAPIFNAAALAEPSIPSIMEPIHCVSCGQQVSIDEAAVVRQFSQQIARSLRSPTGLTALKDLEDLDTITRVQLKLSCLTNTCRGCHNTCFGCGVDLAQSPRTNQIEADGLQLAWHCDQEREFLIGYLLAGYDGTAKHNVQIAKPKLKPNPKENSIPIKGAGIGYGNAVKHTNMPGQIPQPLYMPSAFQGQGQMLGTDTPAPPPPTLPLLPGAYPSSPMVPQYHPSPFSSQHVKGGFPIYGDPKTKKPLPSGYMGFGTAYPPLAMNNTKSKMLSKLQSLQYDSNFAGSGHTLGGASSPTPAAGQGYGVDNVPSTNEEQKHVDSGSPFAPKANDQQSGTASAPIDLDAEPLSPALGWKELGYPSLEQFNEVQAAIAGDGSPPPPSLPDQTSQQQAPLSGIGYELEGDDEDAFAEALADAEEPPDYDVDEDDYEILEAMSRRRARKLREPSPPPQDPDDDLTTQTLAAVTALLKAGSPSKKSKVSQMLQNSCLLHRVADLLLDESLDNITRRCGLYEAALEFVSTLASTSGLTETVYEERTIFSAGHNLLDRMSQQKDKTKIMKARPLYQCLEGLHTQSQIVVRRAEKAGKTTKHVEDRVLQELCKQVCRVNDTLCANRPLQDKDAWNEVKRDSAMPNELSTIEQNILWQKPLRVLEVDDDTILSCFNFRAEAKAPSNAVPGRMRKLAKEVTGFASSLPPGIFVRHGETRMDVMKVLIVGPEGTPYENGLWEFDIYCTDQYPNAPPRVHFRTNGGGVCRVNPNLYEDGKVCLSLLGTWAGEPWKAGKSTLLQVLISIQAMIFCDEPYCNEPSFEQERGNETSKNYNRGVYPMTVKHAMLEWLGVKPSDTRFRPDAYNRGRTLGGKEDPNKADQVAEELWGEVVKKHFEVNKSDILATVEKWTKDKASSAGSGAASYDPSFSAPTNPYSTGTSQSKASGSGFVGTGWGGKTLGGDEPAPQQPEGTQSVPMPPQTSTDIGKVIMRLEDRYGMIGTDAPAKLQAMAKDQDLVSKLKSALREMEKATARY